MAEVFVALERVRQLTNERNDYHQIAHEYDQVAVQLSFTVDQLQAEIDRLRAGLRVIRGVAAVQNSFMANRIWRLAEDALEGA